MINILKFRDLLLGCFFFSGSLQMLAQPGQLVFNNYTTEDGLSNNAAQCTYQDSRGWMWFGTIQGLNRFDGYKFLAYKPIPYDSLSMRGQSVRTIIEDSQGILWVGTANGALNRFNRKENNFTRFLKGKSVNNLLIGPDGFLWVATSSGLFKFDTKTCIAKEYFTTTGMVNAKKHDDIKAMQFDNKGQLLVSTIAGVNVINVAQDKVIPLHLFPNQSDNERIQDIFADKDGKIWFGTFNNGFYIYDPVTKTNEHYIPDPKLDRSFSVRSVCRDVNNNYWIGTRGGLYRYNRENNQFTRFSHSEHESNSLSNNSVFDIKSDRKGDIWICTRGGISYMVSEKQAFKYYRSFENDVKYLNDNEIYAFWYDKIGNIWIGTESGGINILNTNSGNFTYLTRTSANLSSNTIKAFTEDKKGNLWVATYLGGVDVINIASRRVISNFHCVANDPASISDNKVWSILTDVNGNIWMGTDRGLDCYHMDQKRLEHCGQIVQNLAVHNISEDLQHDLWISSYKKFIIYNVTSKARTVFDEPGRSVFCDSKGRYWLTTFYKGIILFDKKKGPIKYYSEKDGLADNNTLCIEEDKAGNLWISTSNGLSKFDPEKETFQNYLKGDGLQSNQFNYGAAYKLPSGELAFGGVNGFNLFNPELIRDNNFESPLVFTDFRIFYKPVPISNSKDAILHEDISETRSIVIPHDKNVFMLEFAALNFAQTHKICYSYKLDGFDKDWIDVGHDHSAIYTNLNPGKYLFRVRVSNDNRIWSQNSLTLAIQVLPPFWATWWFKTGMIIFIGFILYVLVIFITNRNALRQQLILERVQTKQVHELDLMKMKFFTNISHEIRTPLTLIIGPVEKMLQQKMADDELKTHLGMVNRNAHYLLKLVNQLLDFRKIESGNLKLELKNGNIIEFINAQVEAFTYMAQDKGVHLKIAAVEKEVFTFFDPDKVEKIIDNLLSNALKFTNRGGSVMVNISLVVDDTEEESGNNENRFVEVVVKDTGIGISESHLEKVFLRFFQSQSSSVNSGTGIGLALTRELVKLHHGRISVESKPGKGSRFTVLLPFIKDVQVPSVPVMENDIVVEENLTDSKDPEEDPSMKILLVVEDNLDVRLFIRSHFQPEYHVIEASDGKEGINMAFKTIPNVIISDIMMQGVDGIELCRKLKKDERTSHIPIILLSALTSKDSMLQGLGAGADDYISKPFDVYILRTKVENLLILRRSLQIKYSGEMVLQPQNVTISSPDGRFLKKAVELIEKNIEDPEFDSDKFSLELGVSRVQLYRKLNALTGLTVREFIRDIRLKRAGQLLVQNTMNISDVAYATGFRDLSHFRKCFRQEFGMSASEYVEKFKDVR
jgi:signal transduction histidine kinase/ligand-binding sensor domain-containing protein/DNA-binding response OmpR family regulator